MLAITVLILNLVVISSCDHKVLSQELIDFINSLNTTWKAGHNFPGWDEEHLHRLCGVLEGDVKLPLLEIKPFNAIPSSFDSRYQWPNCPTIREIYNQGNCGSCWAVSSAHAMSDRYCTAFRTQVSISAQDLLTCCSSCGYGCDGGYPADAWKYWVNYGIVTGGSYGSNKGCQPYEYAPSDCFDCHSKWTFNCDRTCRRTYPVKYKNDKHYGSTYYRVPFTVSKIQTEIMTNGPVTASFDVYKDFYSYRSGVYQHTYGSKNGGHAVKIIGWGVENKIPYWLVANSWGTSWGQKGYFKIYRGKNECGIESKINAGKPRNIR